jgi:homoserine O-acetyltransferase/O-succinyltransferase
MTLRRHTTGRFVLESGTTLRRVEQAYTLYGRLNDERDNVIVLFHSLTGDADPVGWWPGLIGEGCALDTNRYAVITPNLLGSCYGTTAPPEDALVTTRDMARLVHALLEDLGVAGVRLAAGGSLGGMVALEWAATYPLLTDTTVVFAAPAAHSAHAIGFNHVQRRAIELGGAQGLELARMIAMLAYRTHGELDVRFGRQRLLGGYAIGSYLDHHGTKLRRRFDAASYLTLLNAMDAHDVGRGRDSAAAALRRFQGRLIGVGIPGDLLYPMDEVRAWTTAAACQYTAIESRHGHDGFLLETDQVAALLERVLQPGSPSHDRTVAHPHPDGYGEVQRQVPVAAARYSPHGSVS